jgi:hypothetical protein
MYKSTKSSELEAERLTSWTSQFKLWTEHQYPLRQGWVGFTAGLVDLERRKMLSVLGLELWLVGCWVGQLVGGRVSWLFGWVGQWVGWVGGAVSWSVGWTVS